jgi:predicted dehydrogenase
MSTQVRFTRRQFIQSAAAAGIAGPLILTSTSSLHAAPNDRINLGFIGVGTQGGGHVGSFLGRGDVQIVAICDVVKELREYHGKRVEEHYAREKKHGEYKGCKVYTDFRELLQFKGLDAVLIATPDHWHAIPCIEAARAKKDIYCEKPLTHSIVEGRRIVDAVAQNKVVFQTGSQQRSEFGGHFRKAVEYVRNGRIGKLKTINIGDGVGDSPVACHLPDQPTPEGTDWEMWLGPAPNEGIMPNSVPPR